MSTIFTKIVNREEPARIVWEDEDIISFLPKGHFINPGHILVVPKIEVDSVFDLEDDLYKKIWCVSKFLAGPLKALTNAPRIGIAVEGFSVPHAHIHLCPLYEVSQLDPHRTMPWSETEQHEFMESLTKEINANPL